MHNLFHAMVLIKVDRRALLSLLPTGIEISSCMHYSCCRKDLLILRIPSIGNGRNVA